MNIPPRSVSIGACSWLQRAHEVAEADSDFALIALWVAFNSLYGQWDEARRDEQGWRGFVGRIMELDSDGHMAEALREHKPLVITIFEEEHLSRYFWDEPSEKRARQSKKGKFDARTWYLDGNWKMLLDRILERIYLLRCRLVHGAATHDSKLNRTAVRRCGTMLSHLLTAMLLVWIDRGADADWGAMCYPPLQNGSVKNGIETRRISPN